MVGVPLHSQLNETISNVWDGVNFCILILIFDLSEIQHIMHHKSPALCSHNECEPLSQSYTVGFSSALHSQM